MREIYLGSIRGERGSDHHYILVTDEGEKCRVRKVTVFAESCASDRVKEIPEAEYASHSINGKNLADLVRRALRSLV
ncbi:hypothetical protein [Luteolibacter soli]|uniref:Uncharacterized protein n=1 Tax=Luteolibacter soli TaxID=3135280 RepID=A0ABU9B0L5_9BACT